MKQSSNHQNRGLWLGITLIALATATRVLPHEANFTAMGAVALFAGYLFRNVWQALAVVLVALLISDALLGFDSFTMRAVVYGSLILPVMLGLWLSRRVAADQTLNLLGASAGASVGAGLFFFLTTNLAVWATSGMYTLTLSGLLQSYINALPFYRTALAADLLYSAVLFGAYSLSLRFVIKSEPVAVRVKS